MPEDEPEREDENEEPEQLEELDGEQLPGLDPWLPPPPEE
jgi:hypothetical protein